MGTVYLAEHAVTGRRAAVKILHRHLAEDAEFVRRFINEARAPIQIGHPGIVDIIDVDKLPGTGEPYLLMEYLDGESLASRLHRAGRLRVKDAVSIAYDAAAAL